MDTSSPRSLPELARSIRPWAFGTAVAVGIGFHFFLSHAFTGWPFALFTLIVTGGIILITQESNGLRNRWALWFLVPLLSSCLAVTVYASEFTRVIAFFTIISSLAALAYWLTASATDWRKGIHLWKSAVFIQAALPFRQYQLLFTEKGGERRINSKLLLQIGIGLIVAGPVLLIFMGLFLEGDKYFGSVVENWISFDFISDNVVRLIFDVLVALFASAFFWRIARRSREEAVVQEARSPFQEIIATRSFLFAIGALFISFAGFQVFYLFQGSSYILAQDRTYADYAVSGYQQLCGAAAFAFLILLAVYRLSNMEDRWIRWASGVIAITSIISTLSAGKRLWLYVDAYGLTLSRSWGMQFLALVILLFTVLLLSLKKRWNIYQLLTAGSALTLGLLSLTLLLNHEGFVARYNLTRHLEDKGPRLDLNYLVYDLRPDAIPAIADAFKRTDWRSEEVSTGNTREQTYLYWRNTILPALQERSGRQLTLSDLRAERAIQSIPEPR